MFGGSSNSPGSKTESDSKTEEKSPSPGSSPNASEPAPIKTAAVHSASGEKRSGNGSPPGRNDNGGSIDKKRRSSGVGSKASSFLASAKNTLNFSQSGRNNSELSTQTPLQKLGKQDPALAVPQGQHNNSAGESGPGPKSTFRVGVWEDRNKRCRRTMEDTHAFLYNFIATPSANADALTKSKPEKGASEGTGKEMVESDNGYFAIFDGHAGTFAADWCGKKLHLILEDTIRKNPNMPIPELLDQTFTSVDAQLEKLPLKNSGCTAAIALLRWEDRISTDKPAPTIPNKLPPKSNEASTADKDKTVAASPPVRTPSTSSLDAATHTKRKASTVRQRILYTANVGDARIILCRGGKALRLSYDHKGSDENEGKRIANAGGLILNNRVNGVLAVTRALGDAYMKDLVTGHPYTTETVIQHDLDEFIIIACDGLWDVCSDQDAVDLVREVQDPITASKQLVDHALSRFSTDNLSCMIVRLEKTNGTAQAKNWGEKEAEPGADALEKISEAEKIVSETKQQIAEGTTPAVGISGSNSGRGYDVLLTDGNELVVTTLEEAVEEEPEPEDDEDDSPEEVSAQAEEPTATVEAPAKPRAPKN
ncbi:hypothetical protein C2857_003719 [Epichloe festucae Fl1]|uniref:PPM-type phosphatase domain-containing protein n=1 Tax=Epichloe festucae (strain Fl1) TaxID=877507 RepID=A0A7S9PS35_EPIFF|nr:hypothetical protein C2857_003719 [Epichloe festucae Fl1]